MVQPFRHITLQLTADTEVPVDPSVSDACIFFRYGFPLNLGRVVAALSPDARKAESLGHLWSGIGPAKEGYVFYVATELPYYLPDLVGRPEYSLRVGGDEVFVCNRMVRAFFGKGWPGEAGLNYYLIHRLGLTSLAERLAASGLHPLPMRSFVCQRYQVSATTAEEAVHDSFLDWRQRLLASTDSLISAMRVAAPESSRDLLSHPSAKSFPVFWVAVVGSGGDVAAEQFWTGPAGGGFKSLTNVGEDEAQKLDGLLTGGQRADPTARRTSAQ